MAMTDQDVARPVEVRARDLLIRLAETPAEVAASQELRYRVFCEEMDAKPSHEMAVVRDIASHVAVIDAGRIVEHGATYDIFTAPQHATTRSFLSGVTGVTLPAFVKDRLTQTAPATGGEEVIRVTFAGAHATDPMLARLTQDMGRRSPQLI